MEVIKKLGEGGFGTVELVRDASGKEFARKTFSINQPLPEQLIPNVKKRFIRETKLQKSMGHSNIVPVVGGDLDADPPYYLMPVAIETLGDELDRDRSLSARWLSAISDIVAGLDALHEVGLYHRDLKPANILKFEYDAGGYFYAISDFGLISQKDSTLSKLTTTGMAKGSDYYTAPEITAELGRASAQSDVFSLGCILHDIVGRDARVPCSEIKEEGDFGAVLRSCTRQDPRRRFKTAQAVLDALISIEADPTSLQTPQAEALAKDLQSDGQLSADFWRNLADFLEDNSGSNDARTLLTALGLDRIRDMFSSSQIHSERIGSVFSNWVNSSSFDFDFCDGLSNRLELFIDLGSISVKAECLLAMLELGTSHNRWYVERKFVRLCGSELEGTLAKRLCIELRAADQEVCRSIGHLENSIGFKRTALHPLLVKTLEEIC